MRNVLDRYKPPPTSDADPSDANQLPVSIRWVSGFLAVSGAVLLPHMLLGMIQPAAIIWLFWALNAMGKPWANHPVFWLVSALWNSVIGISVVLTADGISMASLFIVGHSFSGVLLSVYSLLHWQSARPSR